MLSQEHAEYINERHLALDKEPRSSKFMRFFNLTSTLAFLTRKTFVACDDYEILEEGYKAGHYYYYMHVFKLDKVIGICPWGYHKREICIHGRRHTEISSRSFPHIHSHTRIIST